MTTEPSQIKNNESRITDTVTDQELKQKLEGAFMAGFCTSNDLPDQIELVEGSILKTIHHWFEDWYDHQQREETSFLESKDKNTG